VSQEEAIGPHLARDRNAVANRTYRLCIGAAPFTSALPPFMPFASPRSSSPPKLLIGPWSAEFGEFRGYRNAQCALLITQADQGITIDPINDPNRTRAASRSISRLTKSSISPALYEALQRSMEAAESRNCGVTLNER